MSKTNDSFLTQDQYLNVCHHARLLLAEASAIGVFPTPIDELISAAKLTVIDDNALDENLLQYFFKKAKAEFSALKSALSKVLGLFDAHDRLVVIDKNVPIARVPFIKLHETGHGFLPHQSDLYKLIHDCEKTLDPEVTDLFEREANVFASEVMFQGTAFADEAKDEDFSIKVPMRLAKKFGASNYSAFRRYVITNKECNCLVVFEQPVMNLDGSFSAEVRRVVASSDFSTRFKLASLPSKITNLHTLGLGIPLPPKKMKYPITVQLEDANGEMRNCSLEAFNNSHQILMLIRDLGTVETSIVFPPKIILTI